MKVNLIVNLVSLYGSKILKKGVNIGFLNCLQYVRLGERHNIIKGILESSPFIGQTT